MNKFLTALTFLCFSFHIASSQRSSTFPAYTDFTLYRNATANKPEFIDKMKQLLKQSSQLSISQITNVQYHLGRLYEEEGVADSAIVYYEQSLIGEPAYEVIHRALGFIYLEKTKEVISTMNAAAAAQNTIGHAQAFSMYKSLVLKAIPHLEKYQACDGDDDTLAIIINLYKSIKDTERITTLASRLKLLNSKCVTLLADD